MSGKLQTVEERVCIVLKLYPDSRNCDKLLIEKYLEYWHNIITFRQHTLSKKAPTTESIRRCRQKIQASGRFMPWVTVEESRLKRTDSYKEYARGLQKTTKSKTRSTETGYTEFRKGPFHLGRVANQ